MAEENVTNLEAMPNGQAPASKTAAPQKGVEGSTPSASAAKKKDHIEIAKYKLNLYRSNGTLRTEITNAVYHMLATHYGDFMRFIPSTRWSTMEEIVQIVWECEKRNVRLTYSRSRKQIEDGVLEMVRCGAVLQK